MRGSLRTASSASIRNGPQRDQLPKVLDECHSRAEQFFSDLAGFIFSPQDQDPNLGNGVPAIWHNRTADVFRVQLGSGQIADVAMLAAAPDTDPRGALPAEHRVVIPAGATGNVDVTLTYEGEVIDVVLHKTGSPGGGAGTIQLVNAASAAAITDAMSINVQSGGVVRAATIDPTQNTIAAGGVLRLVRTRVLSADENCVVYVRTLRRA
jgi:hypothetical protein